VRVCVCPLLVLGGSTINSIVIKMLTIKRTH